ARATRRDGALRRPARVSPLLPPLQFGERRNRVPVSRVATHARGERARGDRTTPGASLPVGRGLGHVPGRRHHRLPDRHGPPSRIPPAERNNVSATATLSAYRATLRIRWFPVSPM